MTPRGATPDKGTKRATEPAMRTTPLIVVLTVAALARGATTPHWTTAKTGAAAPLRLVQSIPLQDVEGRIDHLAVDLEKKRLFVAALENGTVEVVDLEAGRATRGAGGLEEPAGVAWIPDLQQVAVGCGGDGSARLFDAASM